MGRASRALGAALLVAAAGCHYKNQPPNGAQACAAPTGKRCPDGYHCALDSTCWLNGFDPAAIGQNDHPDAAPDSGFDAAPASNGSDGRTDPGRDAGPDVTDALPPGCDEIGR